MKTIASGLSIQGRRELARFLAENLSDQALKTLVKNWERDVTFGAFDALRGHLELSGIHSLTGNPEVFFAEGDAVVTEELDDSDF